MSRNAVLIRAATAALLLFTTLVILQPHIEAWFAKRECAADGGRWIAELRACAVIVDTADQSAA